MPLPLPLGFRHESTPDTLPLGIPEIDSAITGFPRGRISEIAGPPSSGRTTLFHSLLAASTSRSENTALIDLRDAFDPPSATACGVGLNKLTWIRCQGNAEHALRSADLLLRAGGFGLIALDLAEASAAALRRIPPTAWFRFRRVVEPTPTIFVVIATRPLARSCASLLIETRRKSARFLRGVDYQVIPRRPVGKEAATYYVRLHSLA